MSLSSESFISAKDISENQNAEDELTDLVLSGESVALVGAGFSSACGFPGWRGLLKALRRRAEEINPSWDFDQVPESPLEYADRIHECIASASGSETFSTEVGRVFRQAEQAMEMGTAGLPDHGSGDPSTSSSKLGFQQFHMQLVQLPFRGILTTNYDRLVEEALVQAGRCSQSPIPVPVWGGDPILISQAIRGLAVADLLEHVIHLHGDYRQLRTVILTGSQYSEAYGLEEPQRSRLFHILFGIMMTRRLVFVGFSLRDEYLEKMLQLVSDLGWEWGEPIHFAILPRIEEKWPELQKEALRLKRKLGIQAVFYGARPNDHSELHALVDRIHQAYSASEEIKSAESTVSTPRVSRLALPDWAQRVNRVAVEKVGNHED